MKCLLRRGTRALLVPTSPLRNKRMNLLEHLQPLPTELLLAMAKGELDVQAVAARLVADRGLDQQGKWIGFEASAREWGCAR